MTRLILLSTLTLLPHAQAAPASFQTVSVTQLRAALAQGAYLIDVRTPAEYAAGHIRGAKLLPLADLPERLNEVPKNRAVYVICRSGARSAQASAILAKAGRRAVNVGGGMNDWARVGFPVSR